MSRHHRPIALAALLTTLAPALSPSAALAATPKPEAHANGTLTLRASLSHKVLPNRASSEVYASIKIKAGDLSTAAKKRMPMNLSVVIDRSTSMSGDKIKHAKEAAHKLIDLLGPNDRLAIVSYGSDVRTELASMPVTDANRELMKITHCTSCLSPTFSQTLPTVRPLSPRALAGCFGGSAPPGK